MKNSTKKVSLFISIILLLSIFAIPTLAAGKLSVVQEKFYVLPYSSYHAGYVFAEVKNIGDKPVEFNGGLLELFDEEGNSIESENYIRCYPNFLDAGETGYIYLYKSVKEATDKNFIDDYLLTITGKGAKNMLVTRLEVSNPRHEVNESGYWRRDYLVVDITNNTEQTKYDFYVVFAVRDQNDNLLFVNSVNPSYVGIKQSNTVEVTSMFDSDFIKFFEENNITIGSVEAIAYVKTE